MCAGWVVGTMPGVLHRDGCEETDAYKEESETMIVSTSFGAAKIFEIVPVLVVLHCCAFIGSSFVRTSAAWSSASGRFLPLTRFVEIWNSLAGQTPPKS
jgi:hypothetical protein